MATKTQKISSSGVLTVPMLPMRDIVIFPYMTIPFFIGRPRSMKALDKALNGDRKVFVVAQQNPKQEVPEINELFEIGVYGHILQVMRLQNGSVKALFEAKQRARLVQPLIEDDAYCSIIELIDEIPIQNTKIVALSKSVRQELERYLKEVKHHTEGIEKLAIDGEDPYRLADRIIPLLNLSLSRRQALLEVLDPWKRLELVYERLLEEIEVKKVEQKVKERVQGQIGKTQREYYINEQVKAIQKELGQGEDGKAEMDEYQRKMKEIPLSQEAKDVAEKELKKLRLMQVMSAEANVVRNYLDWLLSMPWESKTEDHFDLEAAEALLDQEHYGLEKIKERIIEYLAVAKKVGKMRGPIICLVGPPGVGKTSLARSVAKAIGKNFIRMSLGGVKDEAEIRGHRRTYVGALPGKIIQSLKKAKSNNPLILLDEIDKMAHSAMGDPAAALLEVLDPEQNRNFMDHYLEVEFNLSDVLFFCTANVLQNIPAALQDRMEVIRLAGYTELEKQHIAQNYLVPKQISESGLPEGMLQFQVKGIDEVIQRHTREAGVRNLERMIAKICRKVATEVVKSGHSKSKKITPSAVHHYLGAPRYTHRTMENHNEVGTTCGLAWTQAGGEILQTEVSVMPGTGRLQLTGQLGDVMKESARAALSYVRAHANEYGIYSDVFQKTDIHIHVPEGAVPKDGPSAGVTMTTSLVSALTGIAVRKEVAMTGEITLRGHVLPIGGLKEKLLAAKRSGISIVLIPKANENDLIEISKEIKHSLKIIPVRYAQEVLQHALESIPIPVTDPTSPEVAAFSYTPPVATELLIAGSFSPSDIDPIYHSTV